MRRQFVQFCSLYIDHWYHQDFYVPGYSGILSYRELPKNQICHKIWGTKKKKECEEILPGI